MAFVDRDRGQHGQGGRSRELPARGGEDDARSFERTVARRELEAKGLKPPPHDLEAEKAVLGAVMIDESVLALVAAVVQPKDFYHPAHAAIFECMLALQSRTEPVDVVTLSGELRARDRLNACGGMQYLGELTECTPTIANAEHHARVVLDRSIARDYEAFARELRALVERGASADELTKLTSGFVANGARSLRKSNLRSVGDGVLALYDDFDNEKPKRALVTSGFAELDKILGGGLEAGNFVIEAARPAMGKSALGLAQAFLFSLRMNRPSAFFVMEMTEAETTRRLLSAYSGVPSTAIRSHQLSEEQFDHVSTAGQTIIPVPLYVDDSGAQTVESIRATCMKIKAKLGDLGLVVIDYLQLMKGSRRFDSREQEIAEISRGLKMLAGELGVPIIALAQLNRSLESRADKRPMLSDLRESGSLEQDANVVLFIYRDEVYDKQSQDKGVAEIIVAKQRNGPTGTVRLAYAAERTWFYDLADDDPRRFAVPYEPPPIPDGKKRKSTQSTARTAYQQATANASRSRSDDGTVDPWGSDPGDGADDNGVPY